MADTLWDFLKLLENTPFYWILEEKKATSNPAGIVQLYQKNTVQEI